MLSLERISGRSGLGLGVGMRRMDYGLSGEWMARAATVAVCVTVIVMNRHYLSCYKPLCLAGFQGQRPTSTAGRKARLEWIDDFFNSLTVFTDVDLSLLDPTSYFGRCLCSGLFYARNKTGRQQRPVGFKLFQQ
ncbi:hypothetical protein [Pseudomonas cedrina]|uniref:hypothetical protein n=1 Tax=Pseudomonas cedrina TaxID=651740 RepID=UPI00103300B7|nr:hypothetical protein [Pseudomonas cedrina]